MYKLTNKIGLPDNNNNCPQNITFVGAVVLLYSKRPHLAVQQPWARFWSHIRCGFVFGHNVLLSTQPNKMGT